MLFAFHCDCDDILGVYKTACKEKISKWYPRRVNGLTRVFLAEQKKAVDGVHERLFRYLVDEPLMRRSVRELSRWIRDLKVGDIVDARDSSKEWYEAVIRYIEDTKGSRRLHLHYIGWHHKYDEVISADNVTRIARREYTPMVLIEATPTSR